VCSRRDTRRQSVHRPLTHGCTAWNYNYHAISVRCFVSVLGDAMARGWPVVVVQVAFALACVVAGSHAALSQTGHNRPGIRLGLPGISIPGVVATSPTSLNLGRQGLSAALPGVNAAGVVTTNPAALSLSEKGFNANLPAVNAGGLVSTTPGAVSLTDKGVKTDLPGANVAGLVKTTPGVVNLDDKNLSATLPAVDVARDLVSVSKSSVNLNKEGLKADLPGVNVAHDLVSVSKSSVNLNKDGLKADLPGVSVADAINISGSSVTLDKEGLKANLPAANIADAITVSKSSVGLSKEGLKAVLPAVSAGDAISLPPAVLAINDKGASTKLPDITVGGKSLWSLPGGDVINHVSPITQLFANMGSAEAFASVDQLLNGLAFGNDAPSACAAVDASTLGPLATADISVWNALAVNRTDHDGYRINGENAASCGSTLAFQTMERTQLPGVLWDASSAFGFKKGTFHMGFSGGATESDTQVKATAALRDAGIAQAGSIRLRSWSISSFSLLTMDKWYAGSAFGSAWGRSESQNFVLGSDSDYDTSTFVAAGFVGTIIPLTETARFDVRGTLSYQRTVGEAHADSLGLAYSDHTIAAADAMLSARLFGVFRHDGMTIRPFIQAGITHHLSYNNHLEIDGVAFTMQEADTTIFTATGLDFELDRTLQFSVGVRHEQSRDAESVTGRFGLSLRLN
jgi:hypothetical protein